MAKYRHDLPQRRGGIFLTDGGMETTLIFHEGIELPHFAAFVLLDSAEGRQKLKQYYASLSRGRARPWHRLCARQPDVARQSGLGRQSSVTTRPRSRRSMSVRSHSWKSCARAGNGQARPASSAAPSARAATATRPATWRLAEAEAYHRAQIAAFVEGGADMVTAYTLTSINEAIGIARAARALADSSRHLVHRGNQRPPGEG